MAVRQAVVPEEHLLRTMRDREVITEGHRNDDCVNLAIIAWAKKGPFASAAALESAIGDVIEEYLLDGECVDHTYLSDKCRVLMEYLPHWADDDIWSYAI